jgi:hypothetical protein
MNAPKKIIPTSIVIGGFIIGVFVFLAMVGVTGPENIFGITPDAQVATDVALLTPPVIERVDHVETLAEHVSTPEEVRGIYITGWTAGTSKGLARTLTLFDGSVLNTVVIDIKDATGKLSYQPLDPELKATGVGSKRIANLSGVIEQFHQKGIYVIGRVSIFQDPFYAALHPEDTLLDTRTKTSWLDTKHIAWLRPDSAAVGSYVASIAKDAYAQGFDEINVDYVRYPSDGQLQFLDLGPIQKNKAETIQDFFTTLNHDLEGIPTSADIFGLTMTATGDVGIGQKVQLIAPLVGVVSPMVYPSHFASGSYGIPIPAKEPYKVIHQSLSDGIAKLKVIGLEKTKLRPWFQDFDLLGVPYTPQMVKDQIQAAHDLGINSWLFWDPRNIYTKEVFKKEPASELSV